jgi:transposase-like protein
MNLIDITKKFTSDAECFEFLESQRWPDGTVRCVTCGNDKISRITRKTSTTTKNKKAQIYQCLEKTCKQQFSATSGTIFHDTRLPILTWFLAVELVMDAKKGMSAVQIQRRLGIRSYQTAWHMVHRIREAMDQKDESPMTGIVEIDETYVGGRTKRRFNRANEAKAPKDVVVAMRERTLKSSKTAGRVRYFHVKDSKASSIGPLLEANLATTVSRVYTDDAAVYSFAMSENLSARHRTVNHSIQWIVPGSRIHTNTVESSFSLLKRGLIGSFHRVSTKHLQRYLNEFEYRFNERNSTQQFENCVAEMCATKPLTFRNLVSQPDLPF